MLYGKAYRPLPQDEDDVGEVLDIPMITPSLSHPQNGHKKGHARSACARSPLWSRSWSFRHGRASLGRLFGPIRSLLYHKTARALLVLAMLTILLGFVFWEIITPGTPAAFRRVKEDSIFKEVLEFERALPQHNPDLPFPEGRKGRYINFSGHVWGSGWNNVVQEHLATAHLALLARRAYVFPPHIAHDHRPFSDVDDLAIPFSAFAYGPITGAPFAGSRGGPSELTLAQDKVIPRAVSEEYFHSVCSKKETVVLSVEETAKELGIDMDQGSALTTMLAWGKKLASMEQSCVDVRGRPIFMYTLFGGPQLLPVWSILKSSPIYKDWDWSPLIHWTLEANGIPPPLNSLSAAVRKSLPPTHPWAWKTPLKRSTSDRATDSGPYVINKLVAVHVRRGDYEGHCKALAYIKASWTSWNAFGIYSRNNATLPKGFDPTEFKIDAQWVNASYPRLPDSLFDPPHSRAYPHDAEGRVDPTTLTRDQLTYLHCWLLMDGIRDKLAAVRRSHPALENVYLMTNGEERWVGGLVELLLEDGWKHVWSSWDLVLSDAARAVSQGVDMAIGNWAEVFVGNGFSSLTSNVVGFRLAQDHPPDTIYFF